MPEETEEQEAKEQKPLMCAFDKDRPCNETCTAFMLLQTATAIKWGCRRMGGLQ